MEGREVTRDNYFARADVADARQRALVEAYLLRPGTSAAELNSFAGLFPNANYMVSNSRLPPTATPDHESLVRRDRAALSAVEDWAADPRFERLQPQIIKMKQRLETFMAQAQGK